MKNKEEKLQIKLSKLESGLLWPFLNEKKAISASRLMSFIKEIEFQCIPKHILVMAANRGKLFHESIQKFLELKTYPEYYINKNDKNDLKPIEIRVIDAINCINSTEYLKNAKFRGNEQLFYTSYKGTLIATYVDIIFEDLVLELKSNSSKSGESLSTLLAFEIQMLIQQLCTKKDIYLLWSSEKGTALAKFQPSESLLKIFELLVSFVDEIHNYSINVKKEIIKKIISTYRPLSWNMKGNRIVFTNNITSKPNEN